MRQCSGANQQSGAAPATAGSSTGNGAPNPGAGNGLQCNHEQGTSGNQNEPQLEQGAIGSDDDTDDEDHRKICYSHCTSMRLGCATGTQSAVHVENHVQDRWQHMTRLSGGQVCSSTAGTCADGFRGQVTMNAFPAGRFTGPIESLALTTTVKLEVCCHGQQQYCVKVKELAGWSDSDALRIHSVRLQCVLLSGCGTGNVQEVPSSAQIDPEELVVPDTICVSGAAVGGKLAFKPFGVGAELTRGTRVATSVPGCSLGLKVVKVAPNHVDTNAWQMYRSWEATAMSPDPQALLYSSQQGYKDGKKYAMFMKSESSAWQPDGLLVHMDARAVFKQELASQKVVKYYRALCGGAPAMGGWSVCSLSEAVV